MSAGVGSEDEPTPPVVELVSEDDVAVVRIQRPPVNALDLETLDALIDAFADVRDEARGLVLTGTGRIFSAGVDLRRLLAEDEEYGRAYLVRLSECFRTLFTLPLPTVAAVNGHAIAGGCILVCACDVRVVARGDAKIGLSELEVGVPFPTVALDIVRARVDRGHERSVVYDAVLVRPEEAQAVGFVDEVVPPDDVMRHAVDSARRLAARPAETFAITKGQFVERALTPAAASADVEKRVVEAWLAPEAAERIRGFLAEQGQR